ncbi:predicted protein, partial [Nematostella vectensis]
FCDQSTDGGGWVVIQTRQSPYNTSFHRNAKAYEDGFGKLNEEFWLGNLVIHTLSSSSARELRVVLEANVRVEFGVYAKFRVFRNYSLDVGGFSGSIGDAISSSISQSGMLFSTFDNDRDTALGKNCASSSKSGWWYSDCGHADLN